MHTEDEAQQNAEKQKWLEGLLMIDFLGIFSCFFLLWLGAQYILGVVEDFRR